MAGLDVFPLVGMGGCGDRCPCPDSSEKHSFFQDDLNKVNAQNEQAERRQEFASPAERVKPEPLDYDIKNIPGL